MVNSLKDRILEISVNFAYKEMLSASPAKRPRILHLYDARQEDKIRFMNKLYEMLGEYQVSIYTQKINGSYPIVVFGDLDKLAFLCKEDFYSEKRNCSIVVEGGTENQRERFIRSLVPIVDVFVFDKLGFPDCVGEYIINLDEFDY